MVGTTDSEGFLTATTNIQDAMMTRIAIEARTGGRKIALAMTMIEGTTTGETETGTGTGT